MLFLALGSLLTEAHYGTQASPEDLAQEQTQLENTLRPELAEMFTIQPRATPLELLPQLHPLSAARQHYLAAHSRQQGLILKVTWKLSLETFFSTPKVF